MDKKNGRQGMQKPTNPYGTSILHPGQIISQLRNQQPQMEQMPKLIMGPQPQPPMEYMPPIVNAPQKPYMPPIINPPTMEKMPQIINPPVVADPMPKLINNVGPMAKLTGGKIMPF